jgi:hypothetical protein
MRPLIRTKVGFSVAELLIVIGCLAIVAVTILPSVFRRAPAHRLYCSNCLKQIGLAFRTWSLDHNDHFPMEESITNGGTLELIGKGGS